MIETRTWRGKDKSDANRRSCYKGLERAATKAASQFRYIPKLENGLPVVSAGDETTMSFELED